MTFTELMERGGPAMWPLLILSLLSLGTIIERVWFWSRILLKEQEIVDRVIDAANNHKWDIAAETAVQARRQPMGRYLYAPLRRPNADPEIFRLALEASADEELTAMRRGDKLLEAVIALAPLLGLLGTVLGLIRSLSGIRLGDIGTASTAGVTLGISESLITTATGLVVAIVTLAFYRIFQALLFYQVKIFRQAGNELELLYREGWPISTEKSSLIKVDIDGGNGSDDGLLN